MSAMAVCPTSIRGDGVSPGRREQGVQLVLGCRARSMSGGARTIYTTPESGRDAGAKKVEKGCYVCQAR